MMKTNSKFWDMLDQIIQNGTTIERPKNTSHPKWNNMIYPVNYGYINNTASSDGAEIDIWIGSEPNPKVVGVINIVDIVKCEAEIKVLYGCTEDEMAAIYKFHNQTNGMGGILMKRNMP